MSQYATLAEFRRYLPSTATVDALSDADITAHIVANSGVFDGYASAQLSVPLSSWGTDVTKHVCMAAAYDAMSQRGFMSDEQRVYFESRNALAYQWFRDVSAGKARVSGHQDTADATDEGGPAVYSNTLRGF